MVLPSCSFTGILLLKLHHLWSPKEFFCLSITRNSVDSCSMSQKQMSMVGSYVFTCKVDALGWERCVGRKLVKRTRVRVLPLCLDVTTGCPLGAVLLFQICHSSFLMHTHDLGPLPLLFPLLECLCLYLPMNQWLYSDLGFKIPTTERPLLTTLHTTASLLLTLYHCALNQCHVLQSIIITWHVDLFIRYQLLPELLEYRLLPMRTESLFVFPIWFTVVFSNGE